MLLKARLEMVFNLLNMKVSPVYRALYVLVILAFSTSCAFADELSSLRQAALSKSQAYEFVSSLTTEVGPRLVGSANDNKAVAWAQAQLKAWGFENVHTEAFEAPKWVRGVETAEIINPTQQRLIITALGGSVGTSADGITADAVIFSSYGDLLEAKPESLAGKIAIVTETLVKTEDGTGYGAAGRIRRSGASEAAKRGAVAFLLRSLGSDGRRFPHTGQMHYDDTIAKIPAAALSAPDAEQLDRLAASGKTPRLHIALTSHTDGMITTHSVVGEIRGSSKPDEIVLIGGHLDSWDLGTGAIDDGAGIAITTAAAKLIRDMPVRPKRTIRVVMFGAEEPGLIGAKAYAKAHASEIKKITFGAEADFGADRPYKFRTRFNTAGEPVAKAMMRALQPLGIIFDERPATGESDVSQLAELGVPVADIEQNGLHYFDLHHTPDDTLDKIDKQTMDKAVAAFAVVTWIAANTDVDLRMVKAVKK